MKKFQMIVCDPPWAFGDTLKKMKKKTRRSAASQYNTMSVEEIERLDVRSLVDPSGCVLALWVPSTLLHDGLRVMESWGFTLKQTYVWVKVKKKVNDMSNPLAFGMGRLFRQSHELVLIGTRGKVYKGLKSKNQRSVILAPNSGHSKKPEGLQDSLELMFPDASKLEMFARRVRQGWTCLGNDIDGKDIRVAIQDMNEAIQSQSGEQ